MGPVYFFLGVGFYEISAAITKFQLLGEGSSTYNDIFTAVGLYLMLLSVCRGISLTFSPGMLKLLSNVSRNSYIMYLIHGPIVYYILKPYAGAYFSTGVSALPMVVSACVFVVFLYVIVEGTTLLVRRAA